MVRLVVKLLVVRLLLTKRLLFDRFDRLVLDILNADRFDVNGDDVNGVRLLIVNRLVGSELFCKSLAELIGIGLGRLARPLAIVILLCILDAAAVRLVNVSVFTVGLTVVVELIVTELGFVVVVGFLIELFSFRLPVDAELLRLVRLVN